MTNKLVYIHVRNDSKVVFYVGMGSLARSKTPHGRNAHWQNVAKKGYTIEIVRDGLTTDEALALEKETIAAYGLENLTNYTEGGDHPRTTDATRMKMSKTRKGVSHHTEKSKALFKKTWYSNTENTEQARNRLIERNKNNNPAIKKAIKCLNDGFEFKSIREAARHYGIDSSYISKHLRGLHPSVKGFKFKVYYQRALFPRMS